MRALCSPGFRCRCSEGQEDRHNPISTGPPLPTYHPYNTDHERALARVGQRTFKIGDTVRGYGDLFEYARNMRVAVVYSVIRFATPVAVGLLLGTFAVPCGCDTASFGCIFVQARLSPARPGGRVCEVNWIYSYLAVYAAYM